MAISLGELASRFDCELVGDANTKVNSVASLTNAEPGALSFLSSPTFRKQLAATRAAAVILRAADADACPVACLINDNPYACYARIATELHPPPAVVPGIHERAIVAANARVAASAQIDANAYIGERSTVGEHTYIGPGCYVGPDCALGGNGRLHANVTIVRNVTVGERFIFHAGVVIGSDGFGNAMTPEGWIKVPQLGGVRVGDDVEIGANCAIDLGALDDTVIDNGVRLDNLVHIAHNVRIGEHSAIAAQCGFAGSAVVGKRCMFGGQAGMVGHITLCDDVIVSGKAMITKSIRNPGVYASGIPAEPAKSWNRKVALFRKLAGLNERVARLEKDKS